MIIKSDNESYSNNTVYYSTSLSWKQMILIINTNDCLMVFVLQQTSLTGFNLQTSHMAENASFSKKNNKIVAKV